MTFMDEIVHMLEDLLTGEPSPEQRTKQAQRDYDRATTRGYNPPNPQTRSAPRAPELPESFLHAVGKRHPRRLRRLGRDLDWLRKQAVKHGHDPESIRWLL